MSGKAKRSRLSRLHAMRRQAARLVARACPETGNWDDDEWSCPEDWTLGEYALLAHGARFDVVKVRRYCEAVIDRGTSEAKTGARVLAMLDGDCPWAPSEAPQSDECDGCDGRGEVGPGLPFVFNGRVLIVAVPGMMLIGEDGEPRPAEVGELVRGSCPDCFGSGHNMLGYIPDVEITPPMWRRCSDSAFYDCGCWSWASEVADELAMHPSPSMLRPTRVIPRGEAIANFDGDTGKPLVTDGSELDARINARWFGTFHEDRSPRWHRGLVEHWRRVERRKYKLNRRRLP